MPSLGKRVKRIMNNGMIVKVWNSEIKYGVKRKFKKKKKIMGKEIKFFLQIITCLLNNLWKRIKIC